jgi:protein TonB
MSTATFDLVKPKSDVRQMFLWENPGRDKRMQAVSFFLAIAFHAALFLIGGIAFVKPAEYGIELNRGGVELYLVAALPKEMAQGQQAVQQPVLSQEKGEVEMPLPLAAKAGVEKASDSKRLRVTEDSKVVGDGSSAEPGMNATTFSSSGQGATDAKAGYLKNPAPPYPYEALERGQEGLVTLSVTVDRFGHPKNVSVQQSSGFRMLDDAALKTVKKWKFSPGRTGFLALESQVLIPIRFELELERAKQR